MRGPGVEVAVLCEDGSHADPGQIGEITCRGDVVMSGYWNNPNATRETLRDGWLYTGDMGSFDSSGYLTLRDRSKDVVISGGSNIYPREVEEALLEHPDVAEACVVGAPDPSGVEVVVAFIVAPPPLRCSTPTCSIGSPGSNGPSATCSSTTCRRTAMARSSSANCAPGSGNGILVCIECRYVPGLQVPHLRRAR